MNASGFQRNAPKKSPCRNAIVQRVAPHVMQGKPVTSRKGHWGHGKPNFNQTAPPTTAPTERASQTSS
jgi:hypothetical protein